MKVSDLTFYKSCYHVNDNKGFKYMFFHLRCPAPMTAGAFKHNSNL